MREIRTGGIASVDDELHAAAAVAAERLGVGVTIVEARELPLADRVAERATAGVVLVLIDRRDTAPLADDLRALLASAPLVVLSDPRPGTVPDDLDRLLADARVVNRLVGRWEDRGGDDPRVLAVTWSDSLGGPTPEPAPPGFRVLAVMTAYNEVDIVRPSVERLLDQGIDVHLIDNWSDDGTPEAVEDLAGDGRLSIERFPPEGRTDTYEWTRMLDHVAEVAHRSDADWCIHHDVDQRRDGPWPGSTLRDALAAVDRAGFDAVDHTIFEFRPTDDEFVDGTEVSDHLRHFELVPAARNAVHVQAWRNGQLVDLATSGGHDAAFAGRRVYPLNFTLRHYPVRSQAHGLRKVFRDRKPRYADTEIAKGWHYHYAGLRRDHRFVRDPQGLHLYDPDGFARDHLLPRLFQRGIPRRSPGAGPWLRHRCAELIRATGGLDLVTRVRQRSRGIRR